VEGTARGPYHAGLLALREGELLEAAARALPRLPDVLLVNGTGRDHQRRAGLALHLGAMLEIPTVGITHRPLIAIGDWPEDSTGALSPLYANGEVVGYWLRTRAGTRPLAVSGGWRIEPRVAVEIVRGCAERRTPEPLRQARRLARNARAARSAPKRI
jgi:deoxyribonuclease V